MGWQSLNKQEIFEVLNKYNLNKNEFIIISGAALCIRDLKDETHDIDISVSKEYYEELLKTYDCTLERIIDGVKIWFIDDVINFSTNFYNLEGSDINGYRVQTVESIIELKKKLGREKDFLDINGIYERWGRININLLKNLMTLFDECLFYIEDKDVRSIGNLEEKIKETNQIKILLTEDMVMAFDREYANGFYRPDWDETIEEFKKIVLQYNCKWHMPDPWTILIDSQKN